MRPAKEKEKFILGLIGPLFFLILFSSPVFAGGPLAVNEEGVAAAWDNSGDVELNPESGACATFTNAQMLTLLSDNLENWSSIEKIQFSFDLETGAIGSVDGSNYTDFIVLFDGDTGETDSLNPVIFDDDGEIVEDVFGSANKLYVLGFAGADAFNDDGSEIVDGQALFNCFCLADNPNDTDDECADAAVEFTEDDLDFTMVHEIGHMIGFDHTQVNQDLAESGCDTDSDGDCDALPTMFPVAYDSPDQITPSRDDEVAALTLYGVTTWEDELCAVTGVLQDTDGNDLRCADVQAETVDEADAIAVVSGAFAAAEDTDGDSYTDGDGECLSDCGAFTLRGLDPAKDYTITVRPIDSSWVGGSSVGPCGSGQLTGIEEEEIGTVTDCTAGSTTDLGTISTESSGGTSSGGDGDDSSGSSTTCGDGGNFDNCEELIGCSLERARGSGVLGQWVLILILLNLAGLLFLKVQMSKFKCQKKLKKDNVK
ncbi:MAG: hypothetical protein HYU99_04430 [Deltaproteobacteria bacterium]|nr:hypothetical protein [Deltaproteobacteria bacterium]